MADLLFKVKLGQVHDTVSGTRVEFSLSATGSPLLSICMPGRTVTIRFDGRGEALSVTTTTDNVR